MSTVNDADTRNEYGFPIALRLEKAKEYAAQAMGRNKPACSCDTCKHIALLPAVQRITEHWGKE